MLQSGDLIFASSLAIIILIIASLLRQPNPDSVPPRHIPSPSQSPAKVFSSAITTQLPYNEDVLVALINELYSLYILLAYLKPSDVVRPDPATSRNNINRTLCNSLGLDSSVISLMERIPYMNSSHTDPSPRRGLDNYPTFLFPRSRAYSFLNDQDIIESRDPEYDGVNPLRPNYLLSHDIALSRNLRDGMSLVLDTKANTVRMLDSDDGPEFVNPEGFVQERLEDPLYYRNYYTQDAPSYLRDLIEKIRSLEIIPVAGPSFWWMDMVLDVNEEHCSSIKKILTTQFGWPNNFRHEDWAREGEDIWNGVLYPNLTDHQ